MSRFSIPALHLRVSSSVRESAHTKTVPFIMSLYCIVFITISSLFRILKILTLLLPALFLREFFFFSLGYYSVSTFRTFRTPYIGIFYFVLIILILDTCPITSLHRRLFFFLSSSIPDTLFGNYKNWILM